MGLTLFTKNDCALCEVAKELIKVHGICIDAIINMHTLYDVCKYTDMLDYDHKDITSFPILYNGSELMNLETFMGIYGEPILLTNKYRHVIFPIQYAKLWDLYEKSVASFWTVNEIDFSKDEADFEHSMTDNDRMFIKHVLAFFAGADGIVNENLAINFSDEVQVPEARAFYSYQQYNETIHSHTYSLMIDRYIKSPDEKEMLLNGVHTIPAVGKKAKWAMKWVNKTKCPSFAKRLIAFACVEGIMFSGSFCAIYWLKKRGLMPGLSFSNELISRDEGMHQDFAVMLFSYLKNRPTQEEVVSIVHEAVIFEKEFINESIPCRLVGMNSDMMSQYIEYVADRLLMQLGYTPIWNSTNPFDFMESISLSGKTNFFERRVGEYAKANVRTNESSKEFGIDEDF
jgi:ribonucleoside-diphosphate reductase beta chain